MPIWHFKLFHSSTDSRPNSGWPRTLTISFLTSLYATGAGAYAKADTASSADAISILEAIARVLELVSLFEDFLQVSKSPKLPIAKARKVLQLVPLVFSLYSFLTIQCRAPLVYHIFPPPRQDCAIAKSVRKLRARSFAHLLDSCKSVRKVEAYKNAHFWRN